MIDECGGEHIPFAGWVQYSDDTVGYTIAGGTAEFLYTPPQDDPVNHPSHYKVGGIETIDFIEAKQLGYHLGNVVKYVTRADHKGRKLEDLKKARWYLDRAI